jgi:hypothetical protein
MKKRVIKGERESAHAAERCEEQMHACMGIYRRAGMQARSSRGPGGLWPGRAAPVGPGGQGERPGGLKKFFFLAK